MTNYKTDLKHVDRNVNIPCQCLYIMFTSLLFESLQTQKLNSSYVNNIYNFKQELITKGKLGRTLRNSMSQIQYFASY